MKSNDINNLFYYYKDIPIRPVETNKKKATKLKKLLNKVNNFTERKRIQIVIAYLNWLTYDQVIEAWIASRWWIKSTITKYLKDPDCFYKTNWTWRKHSNEWNDITKKIENIIEEKTNNWEIVDIQTVQKEFNKRYKNIKL